MCPLLLPCGDIGLPGRLPWEPPGLRWQVVPVEVLHSHCLCADVLSSRAEPVHPRHAALRQATAGEGEVPATLPITPSSLASAGRQGMSGLRGHQVHLGWQIGFSPPQRLLGSTLPSLPFQLHPPLLIDTVGSPVDLISGHSPVKSMLLS